MAGSSLHRSFAHIVFSTKYRIDWIDDDIEEALFAYLGKMCLVKKYEPIKIGGYRDHVHLLVRQPKVSIGASELLETVKKQSSKWMKLQDERYADFRWQIGYAYFSVDPDRIDGLVQYITNQRIHHQKKGYKKELLQILDRYRCEYDERYLWD